MKHQLLQACAELVDEWDVEAHAVEEFFHARMAMFLRARVVSNGPAELERLEASCISRANKVEESEEVIVVDIAGESIAGCLAFHQGNCLINSDAPIIPAGSIRLWSE
jgi:hypothetical protein